MEQNNQTHKKKRPKGSKQLRDIRNKKKKKKRKRIMIITVLVTAIFLVTLFIAGIVGIKFLIHRYRGAMKEENFSTLAPGETIAIDDDDDISLEPGEEITNSPSEDISDYIADIEDWINKNTIPATKDDMTQDAENSTEYVHGTASPDFDKKDIINIMLIGMDARAGLNGRADTMIILTINKVTKQISMTSLLRDMYVAIPGRDPNRLNAAYAYGGSPLVLEAIELNFGIHIDYYITVDFFSFILGIDAVGGIDMEVTDKEVYWINEYLNEINGLYGFEAVDGKYPEGTQGVIHMNGRQALAYARIRYIGSDFERSNRQRKVITAAVSKLKGMSLFDIDNTLMNVLPLITSNIPESLIFDLIMSAPSLINYPINQYRIPKDKTWYSLTVDKRQMIGIDFQANKDYLFQIIYGQ